MATCPECDVEIEVSSDDAEELEIGNPWDCDACGSRLRVASVHPLEFESDDEDEEDDEAESKDGDAEEGDAELEEDDDDADGEDESEDGGSWDE